MYVSRVGIVSGTGTGKKRTLPALRESESCKVTSLHGRDSEKLNNIASDFDIPETHSSLDEFIRNRNFDFAMVCSPPFMHFDQVRTLLEAGIPCLVEKPLSIDVEQSKMLKELAREKDVPMRVAHHLRHQNTYTAIRDSLAAGELGDVVTAEMEWSFQLNRAAPSSKWKLNDATNGLTCMYDAGSHCVDIAVSLFGAGDTVKALATRLPGDSTYESVDLLSKHGSVQSFIRSSRLYGPYSNDLKISGTAGQIYAPNFFTEKSSDVVELRLSTGTRLIRQAPPSPYRSEVEDFARLVRGGGEPNLGTSVDDAIATLELLDKANHLISGEE
jgi:predicted dehydrogenase